MSISKTLFKFAIPNVISMWIFTLYTAIDGIFVSRFIGENALAAVNLTLPIINLIFSLSIMIGVGSSTLIAIKFGENDFYEGNKIFTLANFVNLFLGISLSLIIFFNIDILIKFLGATENTPIFDYTKDYLSYLIFFSVFYMLGYAFEIFIKVDKNPVYPLICVIIGGITNIFLDYLLIVIFKFSLKGAAIATGLSQVVTCSLLFLYIIFKAKTIKYVNLSSVNINKIILILKTGFSEFITEISSGLLILIYNLAIIKKIGANALAVFAIISYITSFITMTMIGFSQGSQPIVSFKFGSKDYKSLKEIIRISLAFLSFLGFLSYLILNFFSFEIISLFFKEKFLINYAQKVFKIYSLSYLFLGINIFIASYFTATKKILYSSMITFPRGIILNSFFLLILPSFLKENGIWLSAFFSEIVTTFVAIYFIYYKRRSLFLLK